MPWARERSRFYPFTDTDGSLPGPVAARVATPVAVGARPNTRCTTLHGNGWSCANASAVPCVLASRYVATASFGDVITGSRSSGLDWASASAGEREHIGPQSRVASSDLGGILVHQRLEALPIGCHRRGDIPHHPGWTYGASFPLSR